MLKILLLIDYSSEFSRRFLEGLIRYSKEYGPWIFYRLPSYFKTLYGKQGIIKWAKEWNADAFIAQWDHEGTNLLSELDIPIILQNYKSRSALFSNLTGDYIATGRMAAQFFAKKKYKNFAFYGNKNALRSRERAEGYFSEVQKLGGNYYYFDIKYPLNNSFDINLSKKFLKDRLSVSVFANYIFNQNRTRLQSIFGNVNIANNTDSRNFGFTINYKIPTKNKLAKEDPNLINNQEKKDDNGGLIPQGQ